MGIKILFVGNDHAIQNDLRLGATGCNYRVECVTTAETALEMLTRADFDVLITDLALPKMTGLDFLALCQRQRPSLITIAITEHGTIDLAVNAMKRGATDVLAKPVAIASDFGESSGRSRLISLFETAAWTAPDKLKPRMSGHKISQNMAKAIQSAWLSALINCILLKS